jgi:hypothetical protein
VLVALGVILGVRDGRGVFVMVGEGVMLGIGDGVKDGVGGIADCMAASSVWVILGVTVLVGAVTRGRAIRNMALMQITKKQQAIVQYPTIRVAFFALDDGVA